MEPIYSSFELEKILNLKRRQINYLCKAFGVEKKGNTYVATEKDLCKMKNRVGARK